MTTHIPPTEATLEKCQGRVYDGWEDSAPCPQVSFIAVGNRRLCAHHAGEVFLAAEIERLRALCGRAEPFVRASARREHEPIGLPCLDCAKEESQLQFADELRDASEGR